MKMILILAGVALLGVFYFTNNNDSKDLLNIIMMASSTQNANNPATDTMDNVLVTPIEHASMVLSLQEVIVYVDPVSAKAFAEQPTADIVLLTDIHSDHLSTSTLRALVKENTVIIAPQAVKVLLPEDVARKVKVMANGDTVDVQGIKFEAMPMYNFPESADSGHVKGRGNGYVVTSGESRVYIAGDTGPIPEMKALKDIDIAFIPMNLPYTMSVEEAAAAVLAFAPVTVYPYHYRQPDGFANVENFTSIIEATNPNINVELLKWYKE